MFKTITICITIAFLVSCKSKTYISTFTQEYDVHGKVKELTKFNYSVIRKNNEYVPEKLSPYIDSYNPNYSVLFDSEGYPLQYEKFDTDSSIIYTLKYTRTGNIINVQNIDNDKSEYLYEKIELDNNKQILSEEFYNRKKELKEQKTYSYPDKNTKIQTTTLYLTDSTYKYVNTFTKINDMYELTETNSARFVCEFKDGKKYFIKQHKTDSTLNFTEVFEYDENKNEIAKSELKNGTIKEIETVKYTYDSHKNWIQKISFYSKRAPSSMYVRQIRYYK